MKHFRLMISLIALLSAVISARAAEMDVPPPAVPKELSVRVNQPDCLRWTDECVNCARGANGEAPICSNIGIACQPKAIRCIEAEPLKSEPSKK